MILRVLSANLWAEHVDPAGLDAVLAETDPDVLAVQELQVPAADVIRRRFPHHALDPRDDTIGNGVATRFPADMTRLPMTYRSGWVVGLDPAVWPGLGDRLEVVNVHLANPLGWPWWRSGTMRHRQMMQLRTHLASRPEHQVVVGDLNATPRWPVYRRLAEVLEDAAVITATTEPTWRLHGRGRMALRIDHVFVAGVVPLRTATVTVPGTDHRALLVELTT